MKTGLIALAAAVVLAGATPALAQTAAPAAATPGLAITEVSAWLASKGGEVGPVRREGDETFFMVKDGPLNWALFFYGCQADVCGDVQFSAVFSNPGVTLDKVNEWNREQRFLKAFYLPAAETGAAPSAAIQYDVLIHQGGVDQLTDPATVWIGLLGQFATHIGYLAPAAAPPAQ